MTVTRAQLIPCRHLTLRAACGLSFVALLSLSHPGPVAAQGLSCLRDALGTLRCTDGRQIRPQMSGPARDETGAPVIAILPDAARAPTGTIDNGPSPTPKTDLLGRSTGFNGLACSGRYPTAVGCN